MSQRDQEPTLRDRAGEPTGSTSMPTGCLVLLLGSGVLFLLRGVVFSFFAWTWPVWPFLAVAAGVYFVTRRLQTRWASTLAGLSLPIALALGSLCLLLLWLNLIRPPVDEEVIRSGEAALIETHLALTPWVVPRLWIVAAVTAAVVLIDLLVPGVKLASYWGALRRSIGFVGAFLLALTSFTFFAVPQLEEVAAEGLQRVVGARNEAREEFTVALREEASAIASDLAVHEVRQELESEPADLPRAFLEALEEEIEALAEEVYPPPERGSGHELGYRLALSAQRMRSDELRRSVVREVAADQVRENLASEEVRRVVEGFDAAARERFATAVAELGSELSWSERMVLAEGTLAANEARRAAAVAASPELETEMKPMSGGDRARALGALVGVLSRESFVEFEGPELIRAEWRSDQSRSEQWQMHLEEFAKERESAVSQEASADQARARLERSTRALGSFVGEVLGRTVEVGGIPSLYVRGLADALARTLFARFVEPLLSANRIERSTDLYDRAAARRPGGDPRVRLVRIHEDATGAVEPARERARSKAYELVDRNLERALARLRTMQRQRAEVAAARWRETIQRFRTGQTIYRAHREGGEQQDPAAGTDQGTLPVAADGVPRPPARRGLIRRSVDCVSRGRCDARLRVSRCSLSPS